MINAHSPNAEQTSLENASPAISPGEVVIGYIKKVDQSGVYVDYPQNPCATHVLALTTIPIEAKNIGREAALLFNAGDLSKPVIVGIIHCEMMEALENKKPAHEPDEAWLNQIPVPDSQAEENNLGIVVDGKERCIEAKEALTLKCGKASITLSKDGAIYLRGTYISSRSTGTQRILGGSVQIN